MNCWERWKNTGSSYNTLFGSFDTSKGDLRLVNVTAGYGVKSYIDWRKVKAKLEDFCENINMRRRELDGNGDIYSQYLLSFDAHNELVTIHPWTDGNGRMSRLVMNYIQFEFGLAPTKVFKDDKAEYINALNESRENDAPWPFRTFMLESHIRNLRSEISTHRKSLGK